MTVMDIWSKVSSRQLTGIMLHAQLADYFDFLNLHGFKREQEYHYFKESASRRGTHRYAINHHNQLIQDVSGVNPAIIPRDWIGHTRMDVSGNIRKNAIVEAFDKWRTWEQETKETYCALFAECTSYRWIADANKINELIKDVDQELKCLDRIILKLRAVDCDITYIMMCQDEMHEYYKEKTKEIGVDIC